MPASELKFLRVMRLVLAAVLAVQLIVLIGGVIIHETRGDGLAVTLAAVAGLTMLPVGGALGLICDDVADARS